MPLSSRDADFATFPPVPPWYPIDRAPPSRWSRVRIFGVKYAHVVTSAGVSLLFLLTPGHHSVPLSLTSIALVDLAVFWDESVFSPVVKVSFKTLSRLTSICKHLILVAANSTVAGWILSHWSKANQKVVSCFERHDIAPFKVPAWIVKFLIKVGDVEVNIPSRMRTIFNRFTDGTLLPLLERLKNHQDYQICIPIIDEILTGLVMFTPEEPTLRAYAASAVELWTASSPYRAQISGLFRKTPMELIDDDFKVLSSDPRKPWWAWTYPSEPAPEGTVRVRWYRDINSVGKTSCLTADFPLDSNGELRLADVRERWNLADCKPIQCDPYGYLEFFQPRNPDVLSPLALRVLTDNQPCLRVTETVPVELEKIRTIRKVALELRAVYMHNDPVASAYRKNRSMLLLTFSFIALFSYAIRAFFVSDHILHTLLDLIQQGVPIFLSLLGICTTSALHYTDTASDFIHMLFKSIHALLSSMRTLLITLTDLYVQHYLPFLTIVFFTACGFLLFSRTFDPSMLVHDAHPV